jgi:hypothetical protein
MLELIPFTSIRYEIMSGNKTGVKYGMKFSDLENNPDFNLVIEIAMPILDITGHPNVSKSSMYQDLETYLTLGCRYANGQTCSICKMGILGGRGRGCIEVGNHKLTDEQFECDSCRQVFKNYLSVSKDSVEVRG